MGQPTRRHDAGSTSSTSATSTRCARWTRRGIPRSSPPRRWPRTASCSHSSVCPPIYYHSLVGSPPDLEGMVTSRINRRINRAVLDADRLARELREDPRRRAIFEGLRHLLDVRRRHEAFSPFGTQRVELLDDRVFAVRRGRAPRTSSLRHQRDRRRGEPARVRGLDVLTDARVDRWCWGRGSRPGSARLTSRSEERQVRVVGRHPAGRSTDPLEAGLRSPAFRSARRTPPPVPSLTAVYGGRQQRCVRASKRALQVVAVHDQLEHPGEQVVVAGDRAALELEQEPRPGSASRAAKASAAVRRNPPTRSSSKFVHDLARHPRDLVGGWRIGADVLTERQRHRVPAPPR